MSALLEVENLRAWYGASQVLHGVDLRVEAGEIVALAGRNGSGRSTFAKALMSMVHADGVRRFAGRSFAGLRTFEIARLGLGYVAEQRDVFPTLTVDENLRLGLGPRTGRFTIDDAYALFPVLAGRRAARAGVLSGGEQQMLALARALVGGPDLLIVDEPTEGLAAQMAARGAARARSGGTADRAAPRARAHARGSRGGHGAWPRRVRRRSAGARATRRGGARVAWGWLKNLGEG